MTLNNLYDREVRQRGLDNVRNKEMIKDYIDLPLYHWAYYDIIEASHTHEYRRYEKDKIEEMWISILGYLDR